jgi:hypothetical protein
MKTTTLILATLASIIALPAFAQSFDPDNGTGNVAPPAMAAPGGYATGPMGAAGAYAQSPAEYDRGYVRHRRAHPFPSPRGMDRDNTSIPGQGVDKDDTTPSLR